MERISTFCPAEGYYLAFSGGKDSIIIKHLADAAGVHYVAHFHMTTVDPIEVLRYTKQYHPNVIMDRPEKSMWQLIVENGMPPTRGKRYCCRYLKEAYGTGRIVLTGIRWAESYHRRKRQMVEHCITDVGKTFVNPIIDWTDEEVWQYIGVNNLPFCSLYAEGFKRIGCVLCPHHYYKKRQWEAKRFPGFYKAYLRAFAKMLEERERKGIASQNWHSAEDVMEWWLGEHKSSNDDRQLEIGIYE